MNQKYYDVIVVGAGTAGLTAAIYTVRTGKTVLVLDAVSYGGQIINTPEIANYPGIKNISGFEFATNLYEQAKELGAVVKTGKVEKITEDGQTKIVSVGNDCYTCRAVVLATGVKNKPIGLPKEKELLGKGISYCATCDGAFYKNKEVAVLGGGNTALEDALFLVNYCTKVYVVHRRDSFRGEKKLLDALKTKENVEFVLNANVISLLGDERLSGIEVEDKITKEKKEISLSGLFVAIGQHPDNASFSNLVELDEYGYVKASEDCRTKIEGIFTAGDCRTKKVRQLTTAASDGAIAALAACEYIG